MSTTKWHIVAAWNKTTGFDSSLYKSNFFSGNSWSESWRVKVGGPIWTTTSVYMFCISIEIIWNIWIIYVTLTTIGRLGDQKPYPPPNASDKNDKQPKKHKFWLGRERQRVGSWQLLLLLEVKPIWLFVNMRKMVEEVGGGPFLDKMYLNTFLWLWHHVWVSLLEAFAYRFKLGSKRMAIFVFLPGFHETGIFRLIASSQCQSE